MACQVPVNGASACQGLDCCLPGASNGDWPMVCHHTQVSARYSIGPPIQPP